MDMRFPHLRKAFFGIAWRHVQLLPRRLFGGQTIGQLWSQIRNEGILLDITPSLMHDAFARRFQDGFCDLARSIVGGWQFRFLSM